ncbi:MAG: hypothetical protein KDA42_08435 [Planctomycetales bacterium]|nr:hypothetical protein [Planctomycetales bacterium]
MIAAVALLVLGAWLLHDPTVIIQGDAIRTTQTYRMHSHAPELLGPNRLTVTVTGEIDGTATITSHNGLETLNIGPGPIRATNSWEHYTNSDTITYQPAGVTKGRLRITCSFEM